MLTAWVLPLANAQLSNEQRDVLSAIARHQEVAAWPEISAVQLQALEAKAEAYLADYQKYHQPFGLTADILFSDRSRSKVEKLDGIGDAATWTGHYLTALALRYSVINDTHILSGKAGQRASPVTNTSTLADINSVLDVFETLTQVTGKKGFIARFAGPATNTAYQRYYSAYGDGPDSNRPGFGSWAFPGVGKHSSLVWLGYPSSDVYIGVNLGFATAYRFVSDTRTRARAAALVESITDRLIADDWAIVDDEGHKSRWQPTPLMEAALLRTAAGALLTAPSPELCKYCDYFSNNLEIAMHYVLVTLETDPARRAFYETRMKRMWEQSGDHLNAWFVVACVSATGANSDAKTRATVQGGLIDFPAPPRWDKAVDHSARIDLAFETASGTKWAKYALSAAERVPSDFMWQRPPFQLKGGSDAPLAFPGLDFLLPYWMARQCGLIPSTKR
jgi:hypothetical protein